MFAMKDPSLLQFDREARTGDTVRANLRNLHGVKQAPSDTWMRACLDEVNPRDLRACCRQVLSQAQRGGKALEGFTCLDGHYLLSVDGAVYSSSKKVHCDICCEKQHRDGTTTDAHSMLGAVRVHPTEREGFPPTPEAIVRSDGSQKNDCERNAVKRLPADVRREPPHLKLVGVEDVLASNGPPVKLLKEVDLRFIVGVKPGDPALLFEWVDSTPGTQVVALAAADGVRHRFRFLNGGAPLNEATFDLEVTFPASWELRPQGAGRHVSRV